ncbi:MAG: hypothetical protein JF597_50410 [Streptomyces sp.]|uniref:hypothetical protein n=1 Tax=Streptomyces sp. TaxID=1931 RepID=UPI0025FD23D0|nr:hypothetical protein [Streptomyces sp.]MBW8801471.1 hypothetical protein [Streptomyces sp.]
MRGDDLLGLPVVGPSGQLLGRVLDVRLVQDGPLLGAFAALRVDGFVVGKRRLASRLGYDRVDSQGPWLVSAAVRRLTRRNRYLPWTSAVLESNRVTTELTDLPALPPLTA